MENVVVTNASSTSALGVIRSLGEKKIPVVATDSTVCSVGFTSRYCVKHFIYKDPVQYPQEAIATLIRIGRMFNKPILLPAGDDIIFLALSYRPVIESLFNLPLPQNDYLKHAVDKALTIQIAMKEKVPVPKTLIPSNMDELVEHKGYLKYPIIIKPRINVGFRGMFGTKMIKVWSFQQLTETYSKVSRFFPKPLIQEYIPGGTRNLFSVCTIFSRSHRPLGSFAIRKLRQLIEGVTSYGESASVPQMTSDAIRMLEKLKWVGPAEVEFKRDTRDGEFKLMEINPRPFMWMRLPIESGLDIPYLWYKMAVGDDSDAKIHIRNDLKFINLYHYVLSSLGSPSLFEDQGVDLWDQSKTNFKAFFVFDLFSPADAFPLFSYPLFSAILRIKEKLHRKKLTPNILRTHGPANPMNH